MCLLEGNLDDRIKMITAAFAAFSTVSAGIDPDQREHVRAVALLLYSGMCACNLCIVLICLGLYRTPPG
jgi:hypothetical protein